MHREDYTDEVATLHEFSDIDAHYRSSVPKLESVVHALLVDETRAGCRAMQEARELKRVLEHAVRSE